MLPEQTSDLWLGADFPSEPDLASNTNNTEIWRLALLVSVDSAAERHPPSQHKGTTKQVQLAHLRSSIFQSHQQVRVWSTVNPPNWNLRISAYLSTLELVLIFLYTTLPTETLGSVCLIHCSADILLWSHQCRFSLVFTYESVHILQAKPAGQQ